MKHVLMVVNEAFADSSPLPAEVTARLAPDDEIRVVAPALNSRLASWASDSDAAVAAAHERLEGTVEQLADVGLRASGEVGDEDPVLAVADALQVFPADRVLVARHAPAFERYREGRVVERLRARFPVPVDAILLDDAGRFVAAA